MTREEFYRSVGGLPAILGGEEVWNFGLVPAAERTAPELAASALAQARTPTYRPGPHWKPEAKRVMLPDATRKLLGRWPTYVSQVTGSCVGAGGSNALHTLMGLEVALGTRKERVTTVWWPYTYGMSRVHSGMRRPGEGSTGEGWAQAITQDGSIEADAEGIDTPDFQVSDNWIKLDGRTETAWSAGPPRGFERVPELARAHLVASAARVTSVQDAVAALSSGYPLTVAGTYGMRRMVPGTQGNPPVRLGRWDGQWGHQMHVAGYWEHPTLGLLFWNGNSWGADAHGAPADDSPPGGFWHTEAEMTRRVRSGEVYALSGYHGFQERAKEVAAMLARDSDQAAA